MTSFDHIHLWGDSLAKGVVFDEARKRYCITPDRCVVQLEEVLGCPIVNHARMGNTARDGLAGFLDSEPDPGALTIIEYGGNDCDMPWAEISENPDADYFGRIPLSEFIETVCAFIDAVRARDMVPLLVTPPPLEAARYFDWVSRDLSKEAILRFLGDVQHIYRWQERYSIAVREIAHEKSVALFDMRDAFLETRRYPELFCLDGIHPNAEGHKLITEAVIAQRPRLSSALVQRG